MPLTPDLAARVSEFKPGTASWVPSGDVKLVWNRTFRPTARCDVRYLALHPPLRYLLFAIAAELAARTLSMPCLGCTFQSDSRRHASGQTPAPPGGGWGGGKSLAQKLAEKEAEAKRAKSEAAAAAINAKQEAAARQEAAASKAAGEGKAAVADSESAPAGVAHQSVAAASEATTVPAVQVPLLPVSEPQGAAAIAQKKKRRSRGGAKVQNLDGASTVACAPVSSPAASSHPGDARDSPSHPGPQSNVVPSVGVEASVQGGEGKDLAARRRGEQEWGVTLDVLKGEVSLLEKDELRRRTRRNLRGFPEEPLVDQVRPAALLRQSSTVDLFEYTANGRWFHLPSVVTWMIMIPSARLPQQPLQGFAAFAAAAEAADVDGEEDETSGKDTQGNAASNAGSAPPPTLDDFELLRLVGAGGFGKVYQCRKKSSGRIMALKAMRKHLVIEELNVEGTRNERSVLETIQHPFIVRLHCAFHDTGRLYLLMDWHNGGHLLRLLHEKSPLSENETRFYLAELVLAIEGLHEQGIVHRDLKPENVLIDCHGHLVVTDFGASKIALEHEAEEDGDIRTNSWVGTEMYMAPEQLLGLVYGRVVDWWAIGVLAFEMLSGENPFYHENPEQVAIKVQRKKLIYSKHLSGPCVSLLKGLLTREPERRLGKGGALEVKSHPFFKHKGFKWQAIYDRTVEPPFDFGVVCFIYSCISFFLYLPGLFICYSMTVPSSRPWTLVLCWVC